MPQATSYDAIVIGTSWGGGPLPTTLAKAGWTVALIERGHVGGTCVNVGCTPTKTMVASARLAYLARRSADYGIHIGPVAVDLPAIRARKQRMVEGARTGAEGRINAVPRGLDLLRGAAHFIAPKTLEVHLTSGERQKITAPTIFINAGQRPKPLQITGAESVPVLTSTTIMELDTLPDHLVIIGGGYIALEFNTDDLALEAAGIQRDKDGYIPVNGHLETNVPGVYALGDVRGGPAFTVRRQQGDVAGRHSAWDDVLLLGFTDGEAALHSVTRWHVHASNPGRRAQLPIYDARFVNPSQEGGDQEGRG